MPRDLHAEEQGLEGTGTIFRNVSLSGNGLTMKIVSQVSVAGIDIYANWILEVISRTFKLSLQGQRDISNALNNLPVVRTADEKLAFGWVPDHALKNLGVHEELYERLALEVSLSEIFPVRYAAKVLWEMASSSATDKDVIPHFPTMVRLVNSSNGLFTATEFPLLVEKYLRVLPDSGSVATADQGLPTPTEMASVLSLLAKITKESNKQMTVSGGPVLAWFAAAAEWLFDLSFSICLGSGDRIHSNRDANKTQLLLVFSPTANLEAKMMAWTDDAQRAIAASTESTSSSGGHVVSITFGGRVTWNSLLSQVFGRSFQYLEREEAKLLGTALGAVARALMDSVARFGHLSKHGFNLTRPVGTALVQLLMDWLPELRRLQSRMEKQLKLNPDESRNTYIESIERLKKACGCGLCRSDGRLETSSQEPPPYGHCLTVLVETIVVLGMVLSDVRVGAHIFPAAQGIRSLYRTQFERRSEALASKSGDELAITDLVFGVHWDPSQLCRLQDTAQLFSGSRPATDVPENLVALAHEGVCVYFGSIEKTQRREGAEDQDLICVTSGGIGVRFKIFTRAALGSVPDADELDDFWEEVTCSHLSQPLYCK